jgi:alpha-tubulin suppressor-like RCC1 family protein
MFLKSDASTTFQVFTFGFNEYHYCGVGLESDREILKPALVTALEMTPCQQVTTGFDFTIALIRSGVLYSWGLNHKGQLGHGHTRNESRPQEVIVHSDDGAPDPMVQVSTFGFFFH